MKKNKRKAWPFLAAAFLSLKSCAGSFSELGHGYPYPYYYGYSPNDELHYIFEQQRRTRELMIPTTIRVTGRISHSFDNHARPAIPGL